MIESIEEIGAERKLVVFPGQTEVLLDAQINVLGAVNVERVAAQDWNIKVRRSKRAERGAR